MSNRHTVFSIKSWIAVILVILFAVALVFRPTVGHAQETFTPAPYPTMEMRADYAPGASLTISPTRPCSAKVQQAVKTVWGPRGLPPSVLGMLRGATLVWAGVTFDACYVPHEDHIDAWDETGDMIGMDRSEPYTPLRAFKPTIEGSKSI